MHEISKMASPTARWEIEAAGSWLISSSERRLDPPISIDNHAAESLDLKLIGLRAASLILGHGFHTCPFEKRVTEIFNVHRFAIIHVHNLAAADIENMMSFLSPVLALLPST